MTPTCFVSLFSFSSFAHHRDLHSFLHDALPISASRSARAAPTSKSRASTATSGCADRGRSSASITTSGRTTDHALDRSEEHTSELQSLRHLVCRLLLEKKKKK